jgi:Mor family transcriptional regulator
MNDVLMPERKVLIEAFPEHLKAMYEIIKHDLVEKGIEEAIADDAGFSACNAIRTQFGGTSVYFGKGESLELIERDFAIYAEFQKHGNYDRLALKYELSTQQIRNILRMITKWQVEQRQAPLFDDQPKAKLPSRGRKSGGV